MLELILYVLLAVITSFFCSISEAMLYSLTWSQIERIKAGRHRKAGEILFDLRRDVEKPITAILTLNTMANAIGATVSGVAAAKLFGESYLAVFALGFTALILFVSEILPKTLGVMFNEKLAPFLAGPLLIMIRFLTPVIWVAVRLMSFLQKKKKGPAHSQEDLKALLTLTSKSGAIKPFEESTIHNVLSLDDKKVSDVMTPRTVVFSLPADLPVGEAWTDKGIWPHSRIPVYDDDPEDIIGVVYHREVLEALARDDHGLLLRQIIHPVQFILETVSLDKCLFRLLESRMHLFVVLDEYGGMAGVITLEDVLEEILGKEIVEESDQAVDMRELARRRRKKLIEDKAD